MDLLILIQSKSHVEKHVTYSGERAKVPFDFPDPPEVSTRRHFPLRSMQVRVLHELCSANQKRTAPNVRLSRKIQTPNNKIHNDGNIEVKHEIILCFGVNSCPDEANFPDCERLDDG